ncbi:MAG: UDP-N-acetylglucosamine 2-epimerase, partial [Ignavibacteriales bacterium]|nr:UDP-N-acetylglucosamine 2-epimerase [Ignavibacteriales bacterium]
MMQIVTITGIRPDFIRMSKIFERLDENFEHIMIHTGQHYDDALSKIFFDDLKIRKPDYTLAAG